MNIVFFGSSNFAVPSLKALLTTRHKISCVVTQPDRHKGRGLSLGPTEIKIISQGTHLEVYQPPRLNTPEALELLKGLKPDLFIVIAYGQILSQEILDIPKISSINVHASLLPKYRGAAPINWAIINGEKETGVSVIKMTRQMDAGPIILQKNIVIASDDTAITLEGKLSILAAELLLSSLNSIEDNSYKLTLQEEKEASFAPKLKKEDGRINWNKSAQDIHNLIRGCMGWPGAFTYYRDKLLKIYKARVISFSSNFPAHLSPGEIIEVSKVGITVATGKGNLVIEELQLEGKRKVTVEEFIAGNKIQPGEILNNK